MTDMHTVPNRFSLTIGLCATVFVYGVLIALPGVVEKPLADLFGLSPSQTGNFPFFIFIPTVIMLFITGMDPSQIDPETGKPVVTGDIVEQTRVIYEKIKEVLEAAGASFEDVVWTTDYITTKENYKATAEIRREYFGESFPASTGIIVKGLLNDNALIEIDAVAMLD